MLLGSAGPYVLLTLTLFLFLYVDLRWVNAPEKGGHHDGRDSTETTRRAILWTITVATCAVAFGLSLIPVYNLGLVGNQPGSDAAMQFLTAWLVEQSLSLDNVFVMAVILSYFSVPPAQHHRVLMLGIIGAIVMRGIFIALGATLVGSFHWMNYVFAVMLLSAAYKLWKLDDEHFHPGESRVYRLMTKFLPLSERFDGAKFITVENGKRVFTRLFVALVLIELTDVMFAFDSIPAVFAISSDPFIVFSSNMFAILNLRSLYSVLAALMERFSGLKTGLIGVLAFIGIKMALHDVVHIPTWLSSVIILTLLCSGLIPRRKSAKNND